MPIHIVMKKRGEELLVKSDNSMPNHRKDTFVTRCKELFDKDLDELYIERMNKNLEDPGSSGIGLILIKKDYSAGLSFTFYTDINSGARVDVTAKLDLRI
jgi:hypothetical protein